MSSIHGFHHNRIKKYQFPILTSIGTLLLYGLSNIISFSCICVYRRLLTAHLPTTSVATYQYPNLIIIEEDDAVRMKIQQLQQAIIATFLTHEAAYITRENIQAAAQSQYQVPIDPQDILSCGPNFVLQIHSFNGYTRMLATGYLNIAPLSLSLMPWNAEHGSTKVPACTQPTHLFDFIYNDVGRRGLNPSKPVLIQVSGIPPHLCTDRTVETLLNKLCDIKDITFDHATCSYSIDARTCCLQAIPPVAHLGLKKKREGGQTFVYIWPVWYDPIDQTAEHDLNQLDMVHQECHRLGTFSTSTTPHLNTRCYIITNLLRFFPNIETQAKKKSRQTTPGLGRTPQQVRHANSFSLHVLESSDPLYRA